MTWVTKREEREKRQLEVLARTNKLWLRLTRDERIALWGIWDSPNASIGPEVIEAISREIGHGEWNAIEQRFKNAGLIVEAGHGLELTRDGRDLMTWATRKQKRPKHLR
jgi:hypothetical protein